MEDGINILYPSGKRVIGRMVITDSELIVYEKGVWVRALFGLLGAALVKGKEVLRIPCSRIESVKKEKFRLNANACYLTLTTGETYILIFDHPQKCIAFLSEIVGKAETSYVLQERHCLKDSEDVPERFSVDEAKATIWETPTETIKASLSASNEMPKKNETKGVLGRDLAIEQDSCDMPHSPKKEKEIETEKPINQGKAEEDVKARNHRGAAIAFAVLAVLLGALNIMQLVNASYQDEEITELEEDVSFWKGLALRNQEIADFMDEFVVIVSDDGTGEYHKYGCPDLDLSGFWVYNIAAASEYTPCRKCN